MRRDRAGIVLQARMGSSRLPGKALAAIAGRPILEHCLRRLVHAGVAQVVLATTTLAEDDVLAEVARRMGVPVVRGDAADVLARFVTGAEAFGFDTIVRATADNPATDLAAPGRLLAALDAAGADYACEEGLPVGAGVEAITRHALLEAARDARDPGDREHVTTYVRGNSGRFRVLRVAAPAPLRRPDLRLTVDTAEDLAWVRDLYRRAAHEMPSLAQLIEAAGQPARRGVA